ncbi:MAG: acyl-CoA dehydrogenase family protein [Cycloclasticus sp.]
MVNLEQYGFTQEHQQVYDMVYKYSRDELYPLSEKMDNDDWFPEAQFRKMSEVGILGLTVPEEYGGPGMDLFSQAFACEAMSIWNHTMAGNYLASDNLCINNILRNASEELKQKYLPGFCDGSYIGALGLTEPGAGSDALGSMATTARLDGDHYVLNGRKMFITNGPVADVLLVYAKTDPDKGAHGISAFIVEKDFPGFSVAQKLVKMGWRGSETGELVFDDCRVPVANMVGEKNNGVSIVMSGLNIERVVLSSHCIGIAERALEISIDYAKQRQQFKKPIATFQMVQAMIAEMYTDLELMRCMTYQLLKEVNELEQGGGGRGEIHMRTAAVALHAGRACMRILDNGVQIHGGMGFMWESEINRLYRTGKILEIGAGTNEVRKLIIAGELLK